MRTIKVGKINLNLTNDIYDSLAQIDETIKNDELRLLNYVRDCSPIEYQSIIEKENSYYFLDALSAIRENVVRWLPIEPEDKILEIGAGVGAITSGLLKMSENVTAFEKSVTNARILAERFANCNELTIYSIGINETLTELKARNELYEWILIDDIDILGDIKPLLAYGGHIVFMAHNRYGMKYMSGCAAPKAHDYFETLTDSRNPAKSLSYIQKKLADNMILEYGLYYPYPDHLFMKNLYSDKRLPGSGELTMNMSNYDQDRLELFSEKDAFETAISEGSFKAVANSYMVVCGPKLETIYARFSNDRADEHTIFTTIDEKSESMVVRKHPLSNASEEHIKRIYENYTKLKERYEGSELEINLCTIIDKNNHPVASFEYVEGKALSELMDECLYHDDLNGFYELFDKYVKYVGYKEGLRISDIDIVFSNVLVNNNIWTLIDYEWCKEESILTRELAYRAIYCYILEDKRRDKINLDLIRERLGLSKAATDEIEADEVLFQKYVTGKNKSLAELREAMGIKSINPVPIAKMINQDKSAYVYQVYMADATGQFSEQNSYFDKNAYKSDSMTESMIIINPADQMLRIDPINAASIVRVLECRINDLDFPVENRKYLMSNGRRINDDSFVFDTNDPNMIFNLSGLVREENSFLYLKLSITRIDESIARALCEKPKLTDYLRK